MDLNISTPALLFPAISLLLLAYTNRFLTIANLIRQLHSGYRDNPKPEVFSQIQNLRYRVRLIKDMQLYGIVSLLLSVVCMFAIFAGYNLVANLTMGISLILLAISLVYSVREIQVSTAALKILLSDMEK